MIGFFSIIHEPLILLEASEGDDQIIGQSKQFKLLREVLDVRLVLLQWISVTVTLIIIG